MYRDYLVVVITSDGEELEDEIISARSTRDATGRVFVRMGCYGVQTIFVSRVDAPDERASYQQVGRTLRVVCRISRVCPRDAQRATSKRAMREKRRSQVDERSRQKSLALVIGSEGEDAQSKFAL